jgi:hypothetical protein
MPLEHMLRKAAAIFGAAFLPVVLLSSCGDSVGKDDYVGKYKTKDTQGGEMTITLSEDGTATGQRKDETLTGKWKGEEGEA